MLCSLLLALALTQTLPPPVTVMFETELGSITMAIDARPRADHGGELPQVRRRQVL